MTGFLPGQILVPVDFSIHSARAFVIAGELARRFSSGLTVVHVIELISSELASAFDLAQIQRKCRHDARLRLSQFAAAVEPTSAHAQQVITLGRPVDEITALAASSQTDLIVIGTHGNGESARERFIDLIESDVAVITRRGRPELQDMMLGSTAERIVRHAPCPVLVARNRDRMVTRTGEGPPAIQKIILATDLSLTSLKAFPVAQALAHEFAATLSLSYALPSTPLFASVSEVNRLRKEGAGQLARFRYEYLPSNLSVEMCLLDGAADHALCQAARLGHCDLIVMATHGYTGLKHALLGSTTERVVRHAPCPVLVVR